MNAEYECQSCGFKWSGFPGPTGCPMCNHSYVKWTNYEEWKKHASEEYRKIIDGK
jgi:hypothetical protein